MNPRGWKTTDAERNNGMCAPAPSQHQRINCDGGRCASPRSWKASLDVAAKRIGTSEWAPSASSNCQISRSAVNRTARPRADTLRRRRGRADAGRLYSCHGATGRIVGWTCIRTSCTIAGNGPQRHYGVLIALAEARPPARPKGAADPWRTGRFMTCPRHCQRHEPETRQCPRRRWGGSRRRRTWSAPTALCKIVTATDGTRLRLSRTRCSTGSWFQPIKRRSTCCCAPDPTALPPDRIPRWCATVACA